VAELIVRSAQSRHESRPALQPRLSANRRGGRAHRAGAVQSL